MRPGWHLIELVGGPHDGAQRWAADDTDGPYFVFSNKHREPGTCKAPGWSSVTVYTPRNDGTNFYDYTGVRG
jgi:hypothetical protein